MCQSPDDIASRKHYNRQGGKDMKSHSEFSIERMVADRIRLQNENNHLNRMVIELEKRNALLGIELRALGGSLAKRSR